MLSAAKVVRSPMRAGGRGAIVTQSDVRRGRSPLTLTLLQVVLGLAAAMIAVRVAHPLHAVRALRAGANAD